MQAAFGAIAYKSVVRVIAPPGIRVEMSGIGVTSAEEAEDAVLASAGAPVVRGLACKGRIEIRTADGAEVRKRARTGKER